MTAALVTLALSVAAIAAGGFAFAWAALRHLASARTADGVAAQLRLDLFQKERDLDESRAEVAVLKARLDVAAATAQRATSRLAESRKERNDVHERNAEAGRAGGDTAVDSAFDRLP